MIITGVSDLHIGKWNRIKHAEEAAATPGDILYFGGDLAEIDYRKPEEGWRRFEEGLEILAGSPAEVKLFTLGNNDLEQLRESKLCGHYREMQERVGKYGFHLLDKTPFVYKGIAFVGNVGWFDGSTWTKSKFDSDYPNTVKEIEESENKWFEERYEIPDGLTSLDFYRHCRGRLKNQLKYIIDDASVKKIVVGIHFVPSKDFVLTGVNARYDYLNWYMGSEEYGELFECEKVVLGLTGHTHRSEVRKVGGVDVHNISGDEQPVVLEI